MSGHSPEWYELERERLRLRAEYLRKTQEDLRIVGLAFFWFFVALAAAGLVATIIALIAT